MLSGCGDPNRSRIIGSWEIEQANTVLKRISGPGSEAAESDHEGGLESSPAKMTIRFLRNGQLETATNLGAVGREKSGTWKLISFDEATRMMTLLCEIQDQETEHKVEFLDRETIKLVPPNMAGTTMKIRFKRQH